MRINLKLELSGLFSSLFVIRFSLIFQKKIVVGGTEKSHFKLIKGFTINSGIAGSHSERSSKNEGHV